MAEDKERLDQRQTTGIREGAGLSESRINEDFKIFLAKWGPWMLGAVALGLGWLALSRYLESSRESRINAAFTAMTDAETADGARYPILLEVARRHGDIRGIGLQAKLAAARDCMDRVIYGFAPNATINPQRSPVPLENERIDEEGRRELLAIAEQAYKDVFEASAGKLGLLEFAINAAIGLGTVAESRENFDIASTWYTKAIELAESRELPDFAVLPRKRLDGLVALRERRPLYSNDDVPQLPPEIREFYDSLAEQTQVASPGDLNIQGIDPGMMRRLTPEEIAARGLSPAGVRTPGQQTPGQTGTSTNVEETEYTLQELLKMDRINLRERGRIGSDRVAPPAQDPETVGPQAPPAEPAPQPEPSAPSGG